MHKKNKEPKTIYDYPENLRGESQNKWGGHKATSLKTFPQSKTPHGPCKTYTQEEVRDYEKQMRERGNEGTRERGNEGTIIQSDIQSKK